jgi:hypothetical protein
VEDASEDCVHEAKGTSFDYPIRGAGLGDSHAHPLRNLLLEIVLVVPNRPRSCTSLGSPCTVSSQWQPCHPAPSKPRRSVIRLRFRASSIQDARSTIFRAMRDQFQTSPLTTETSRHCPLAARVLLPSALQRWLSESP